VTALANVLVIARLTLLEALRRRILRALIVLTVVIVVLTGLGFGAIVDNARHGVRPAPELEILAATSQLLILVAFMFSFVLAMTAAFLGSPAISADLESGVLLAIAARPIRRAEILVGKWLGLGVIAGGYAVVAGLLEIWVVNLTSGYMPPEPLVATLYLAAQATVLLSVSVLLSTRLPPIAGGAVAVVLFGLSWITGILVNVADFLNLDALARTLEGARYLLPLDGLWRGTEFALEPQAILLLVQSGGESRAARIVANSPFYAASGPPPSFMLYVALWTVVVLSLAIVSFRRREI
jgi:ABC-type transport system involved in multi-copper enzyme maturation permease subunit